jgi:hypothetical protein
MRQRLRNLALVAAVLPIPSLAAADLAEIRARGTLPVLAKKRDPALRAGAFVGSPGSGAWSLRSSDVELKRALDDYLTASRRSGAWSRLVIRYYGQDALDVLGRGR